MKTSFVDMLMAKSVLLADGATGTNLFAAGLSSGDPPELWNLDQADRIRALHQQFVDAGSDVILTNSFGGNRYRLALHGAQQRVAELNAAGARLAREVADRAERPVIVAGSIGPTGEILAPLGALTADAAVQAFREQAEALADGGVDVIWIETMSSSEEAEAAIEGARGVGLPVTCTLSFDTNGRTMMGISPADFVELCRQTPAKPHAFGANCGLGPAEALAGLLSFSAHAAEGEVLVVKANCGVPAWVDGAIHYHGDPSLMATYACLAVDAGARVIGGCCGTRPEHIRAMRHALDAHQRRQPPSLDEVTAALGEVSSGARGLGMSQDELADAISVARTGRGRRRRARGRY